MSTLEPSSEAQPASGAGGDQADGDARFEPPPDVVAASGELSLSSGREAVADRVVEGLAMGASFAIAAGAMWYAIPIPGAGLVLIVLATTLAWWALLHAREAGTARVSWDAWGITLDASGDRVAIPWATARAVVVRAGKHTIVQVSDADGRAITCATGSDLPGALRSARCVTSAGALHPLLEAVARLPRKDRVDVERTFATAPLAPAVSAVVALVVVGVMALDAAQGRHLLSVAAVMVVLAIAVTPALVELRHLAARWLALRGAREVRLEGSAGAPVVALGGSKERAALRLAFVIRDARVGERGETAWVRLDDEARAGGPYRGRDEVRALAVETRGERSTRRWRTLGAAARIGVAGCFGVTLAWAATIDPPRPIEHLVGEGCMGMGPLPTDPGSVDRLRNMPWGQQPPSPEPPAAAVPAVRPEAERARAAAEYEERRAVERWRDRGPHYEWAAHCEPGRGCRRVPVAVDPAFGERVTCVGDAMAECRRITGRMPRFGER